MQTGEQLGYPLFFRCINEKDVGSPQVFSSTVLSNDKIAPLHGLPSDDLRENVSERIVSRDSDNDGGQGILKGILGPFNELEKIEQIGGFDLIFRKSVLC